MVVDRRTGEVYPRALLFCSACADPEEVQDYAQFEPTPPHDAAAHAACIMVAKDERHAARP
jgi:hypothetical protein